ncbi:MAG: type VI secretion system baseplate subunit TssG [Planctomycetes bacterium]|nr:type VI secretion system baseplate subunit TssG [Planctomycetota bacterium]MCW8135169.1 type VI secretion system baseplate subunit TssG [Planctomycetota bacterium]
MAGTDWQTGNPVAADLLKNARLYSFFQAVRTLQSVNRDAPRIGHNGPPQRERIRLRPVLDFAFPLSDIDSVEEIEQEDGTHRYRIDVAFMGLYGTSSPLPSHYTEDFLRREERESLLRGFLDIFHHRLLSLFYRVWEKYRHTVQYDARGNDWYSRRLLAMLGAELASMPQLELRVGRLLAYAGLMTQQPRSAETFRALLAAHYPESPVAIEQCRGAWAAIPPDQCTQLGARNCVLGGNAMLGNEVFDRAGSFEVRMGPMALDDYLAFMPGNGDQEQLRELIDMLNNDGLEYELTVILRGGEVPRAQLNSPKTRLGWSSWLGESRGEDRSVTFRFRGWKHGRG